MPHVGAVIAGADGRRHPRHGLYAARKDDLVRSAADGICRTLTRRLTGARPSDREFRHLTELGAALTEQESSLLAGIETPPILMPYKAD